MKSTPSNSVCRTDSHIKSGAEIHVANRFFLLQHYVSSKYIQFCRNSKVGHMCRAVKGFVELMQNLLDMKQKLHVATCHLWPVWKLKSNASSTLPNSFIISWDHKTIHVLGSEYLKWVPIKLTGLDKAMLLLLFFPWSVASILRLDVLAIACLVHHIKLIGLSSGSTYICSGVVSD